MQRGRTVIQAVDSLLQAPCSLLNYKSLTSVDDLPARLNERGK
jgi:hypothetical protein